MAMRPLEKLPSIRAKLGSVIVLAVAMTLLISYAVIGYALRDSPRDSEAIDTLRARGQGGGGAAPRASRRTQRSSDAHPTGP